MGGDQGKLKDFKEVIGHQNNIWRIRSVTIVGELLSDTVRFVVNERRIIDSLFGRPCSGRLVSLLDTRQLLWDSGSV